MPADPDKEAAWVSPELVPETIACPTYIKTRMTVPTLVSVVNTTVCPAAVTSFNVPDNVNMAEVLAVSDAVYDHIETKHPKVKVDRSKVEGVLMQC